MWLITLILTFILWLFLNNILIAAIVALFVTHAYTVVRTLYRLNKQEGVNKVSQKNNDLRG